MRVEPVDDGRRTFVQGHEPGPRRYLQPGLAALGQRYRPEARMPYDDLRALFINCTLKRSPELSHTQGLVDFSRSIMEKQGVTVEVLRAVDHDIATGVWPDMTEHGWASDAWPAIYRDRVLPADILVIAGPIWLGDNGSVAMRVIELLYACSSLLHDAGQYAFCGRV